jgi:endonuclease/exonuclease/phosphatase family metal-dependent hydrolase
MAVGGVFLLSKTPFKDVRFLDLPSKYGRKALVARFNPATSDNDEKDAKPRLPVIAVVHLESELDAGETRAKQLAAIFAELKEDDDAVILGDFNFGDDEQPETRSIPSKFHDVWKELLPQAPGLTWDIEKNPLAARNSFPGEGSRRLDRVLLRSTRRHARQIRMIGDKPIAPNSTVFPSDHFGLECVLLRKQNTGDIKKETVP